MKKTLKQLFIPVLTSRPITAITDQLFNCGVPVFMLHRMAQQDESNMGKTSPAHLRNCLSYLADHGYTFISLEKLILTLRHNQKLPPKSVAFTIDDGYIDQAEIAAPIFLEYNCPVTFFVITGMLNQEIWPWDAQVAWIFESSDKTSLESCASIKSLGLNFNGNISKRMLRRSTQGALKKMDACAIPDVLQQLAADAGVTIPANPPHSYQPMTWDMARQLEAQGISFAPHTVSHNILSRLSRELMEKEIQNSWQTIEKELSAPLKVFCYPTGRLIDFGEREIETVQSAGYLGAVSTIPGIVRYKANSGNQVYSLPRLPLPDNMIDLIQYCSWIEDIKGSYPKTK